MNASATTEEIEAIIARTALKYDLLPYQSKPFPQSQPSRLGGLARLFDLEAAPLRNARVLELGCASGGNIIPHAMQYPEASFVGVDLARTQVAAGRARIARLGLTNIEIHCQSFTEIGDELGSFDYIICHGVYSWVPAPVQDAILRIIKARLSPVGVACVSYNVLPGWRMLQPLRDAFELEVPDHVDSHGRVAKARELLEFLSRSSPDKGPYGDMLRSWATRLAQLPDHYIAHEFLEEMNQPSTVRDFAGAAARHGLGFLSECDLASMILDNYGPEVAAQVRARSGNDLVKSEQYLDLISGRTFRQTLLVASERMAAVDRALVPERLADLHILAPPGMKVETRGKKHSVSDSAGRTLTTTSQLVADSVAWMLARAPSSSSVDECLEATGSSGDDGSVRPMLLEALYRMLLAGMITVASEPVSTGSARVDRPRALELARSDAAAGELSVTNARHESVSLDPATHVLLPAMDGRNDHKMLVGVLVEAALSGRIAFSRNGIAVTGADAVAEVATSHLPGLIAGAANAGLLTSD